MGNPLWNFAHELPRPFEEWAIRIGRVAQIASFPCSPTPEVWAYAFWQALPTLILTPVKPSATDYLIVRMGGRHSVNRKFKFDIWDHESLPAVPKGGWQWAVWRLASLGTRALWYMALVDAYTGFAVNFESAAYQYMGCKYPGEAYCQQICGPGYLVGPEQTQARIDWGVQSEYKMSGGGYYLSLQEPMNPSMSVNVNTSPWPGQPQPMGVVSNVQVRTGIDGRAVMNVPMQTKQDGTQSGTACAFNTSYQMANTNFYVTYDCTGGYALINGNWSAFGRNHWDNIKPDP